ncbi:MAG: hypothetical protein JSW53_02295, partial [Candidatus Bathyarchaeota archaeon]
MLFFFCALEMLEKSCKVIKATGRHLSWEKMKARLSIFTLFLLGIIALGLFDTQLARSDPVTRTEETIVRVIPEIVELGPENVTGQTFPIAVAVENANNVSGLEIKFQYDPTYLDYVSHVQTMPVEDFPDPIPPSPYPGIIHSPPLRLRDDINATEGSYWAAFSTLGGPYFNGSGTVFVMTFRVRSQPAPGEGDIVVSLDIVSADVGRPSPIEPPPTPAIDGTVIIHALAPTIDTTIRVLPEVVELGGGNVTGQTFTIALVVENVSDLDGVDILLGWNTTYL